MKQTREELWELVRAIPRGRVSNYGALGAALRHPASGLFVGRWLAFCSEGVPWWRVVAKDGGLPISKRDPVLGLRQREILIDEGATFVGDRVDMARCGWEPDSFK